MKCEKCDALVQIGDWPFCPHGTPNVGLIDDQLEGGARFFETMGHEPVWIESKSQWRREVAAREIVHLDKHDRAYYTRQFRQHEERLRDAGEM